MGKISYSMERSKQRTKGPLEVREECVVRVTVRDEYGEIVPTVPMRGRLLYENGEPVAVWFDDFINRPKNIVTTPALAADSVNVALSSTKLLPEVAA